MPRLFVKHVVSGLAGLALVSACAPTTYNPNTAPPPGFPQTTPITGKICGGFTAGPAQTCDSPREYCHRTIGDYCGAADAPGVCRPRPQACTMDYNPVCGCDGKTYPNECAANANGVSANTAGECPT